MQKGDWVTISEDNNLYPGHFGRVYQVMVENVGVEVRPSLVVTVPKNNLRLV